MTKEQRQFLDRRFREAVGRQRSFGALKRLLLSLGGRHLVAPPGPDPDLSRLIDVGFVMAGPVVRRNMTKSGCHGNMAEIWTRKRREIIGVGTGYSLSDDGLWRQHSWGVRREGILETSELRAKYFGILLQGEDADAFARANLTERISSSN
jgi:hypothetical protein